MEATAVLPPASTQEQQKQEEVGRGDGSYGVLLYYKYGEVPDAPALAAFYESHCRALVLVGRVRVGPDGVNATLGGRMAALEKHIEEMSSNSLFDGTDFKLASCEDPADDRVARECGFTSLSVRLVKELVTLCSNPSLTTPDISFAGSHLSAAEFHSVLQSVGSNSEAPAGQNDVVVLDARNLYETRIGKFHVPNVETLHPEIRQYSDLPLWIDEHTEKLRGKSIMMYCTGGIRCEMASAYIRSKGEGFENVFQLYGGIQRYLEHYPDGGYFGGKNFVFDHRISVGSIKDGILGTCLICGSTYDDYSSRCRCSHCRMLVLVCSTCQDSTKEYVCELCQKNGKQCCEISVKQDCQTESKLSESSDIGKPFISISNKISISKAPPSNGGEQLKKLRILCLHGFRQNSSNFKGRTSSLAKKLKHIAELVFIDAPHELSFVYQPDPDVGSDKPSPPSGTAKTKFAWLVSPNTSGHTMQDWRVADTLFDPLQYQRQTDGFKESYAYLENIIAQDGSFDGVLGFSQGAAMAALLCRQQQKTCGSPKLRFGIFCSGYPAPVGDFDSEPIRLPSLHCFGGGEGHDRQIASRASTELAGMFEGQCTIIEHDMGHIIPTRPPYIDRMKEFLCSFI